MSLVERHIVPEWLDALPADDKRAIRSRQDLARINVIMFQARIMGRLLREGRKDFTQPIRVLELGGGDGRFMLSVARSLAKLWPAVTLTIVDQQDIVAAETHDELRRLGWTLEVIQADVFAALPSYGSGADLITANLFLHHFDDPRLKHLFAHVASAASWFVACEPRRSRFALASSYLVGALGCNDVSRHDAVVSVKAGFTAHELSDLWPLREAWDLREHQAGLFTHVFVAQKPSAT